MNTSPLLASSHEQQSVFNDVPSLDFCLRKFDKHTLVSQERASLLNRIDDKFVIDIHQLTEMLAAISNEYSLLEIQGKSLFSYETFYYDTHKFALYNMHHSGKKNRFKIRTRRYLESNRLYHEIKIKDNKGLTTKIRKEHREQERQHHFDRELLNNTLNIESEKLEPKIKVNYKRLTLLNKTSNQRVTIDLNIEFKNIETQYTKQLNNIAIIEIKRDRENHQIKYSSIHRELKNRGYRKTTFSKYCMGCLLTNTKGLKHNQFKTNLLDLSKTLSH